MQKNRRKSGAYSRGRRTDKRLGSVLVVLILAFVIYQQYPQLRDSFDDAAHEPGSNSTHTIPGGFNSDSTIPDERADVKLVFSARVSEVIDGDTVILDNSEKVRFIGIDTPEREQCGYHEARNFVIAATRNKDVDVYQPSSVSPRDRYGRLLAYLRVDGEDLGAAILVGELGVARYDSTENHDWHPYEDWYHQIGPMKAAACR